ncbi:acetyltransferase, N-acetylglutamate synthase [Halodesulfurarchaeum formicicum]|uniref:Acetyltransferase, N-acetylglutamate synthase n=1 Tax=Halodesulfurarchaeum formicicum TaxID=1873524 RepID=A0A1D8S1U1_9EURY|nr:GNAT family N-acetyltransferase [Halodesulfurarchaeum formicicum]AOW79334.1 acetyltransferase, N-acetylglutamate synthase [Halodesulfurarchaeum formicicum]APE94599.1 acetyltransferase, N-acetylglutamate synthase [Halodesulfurarchaeum formicicum]
MTRSIRRAQEHDRDQLLAVRRAAISGLTESAAEQAWIEADEPVRAALASPDTAVFVVEDHGSIAGFGWLEAGAAQRFEPPVDGQLGGVFVHPHAARSGIGTLLVEAIETRAVESGLEALGLLTPADTVPFFEAQGYSQAEVAGSESKFQPMEKRR